MRCWQQHLRFGIRAVGRHALLGFTLLWLAFNATVAVQAESVAGEYQLKAVFLLNFTKFVNWPPSAFPDKKSPFVVGILGDDPFGAVLQKVFEGHEVDGHKVVIRHFAPGTSLRECHVLFVSRSTKDRPADALADLQAQSVLTVGEAENFLEAGGMINFIIANERVRFEINAQPAERVQLKLGAKLLSVAAKVIQSKGSK